MHQDADSLDMKREAPPALQRALSDFLAAAQKYVEICSAHGITGEKSAGRKTLCKPKLINEICGLLADSVSIRTTCQIVGIAETTFHAWCVRGALEEAPYAEFLQRTTRARAQARVSIVRGIRRAGAKDHRALEWLAEHLHADEFCPPKEQQVNVQVKRGRDGLLPAWAVGPPIIRVIEKRVEPPNDQ